jgi:polar amino acid transport system substrate-binding protein
LSGDSPNSPNPSEILDAQAHIDAVACALGQLVDLRDIGTGVHSTQIVELAIAVGAHFGLQTNELRYLEIGASLHDLGKIGVPDGILQKPGKLSETEFSLMRRHPEFGWAILRHVPGFEWVSLYILHHHERWDGRGYPGGLKGDEIPFGARILAVVDAFHAMISDRPYRKGMSHEDACQRLEEAAGSQFDPVIVEVFVQYVRQQFAPPANDHGITLSGRI